MQLINSPLQLLFTSTADSGVIIPSKDSNKYYLQYDINPSITKNYLPCFSPLHPEKAYK
jgi:hypothetical protein